MSKSVRNFLSWEHATLCVSLFVVIAWVMQRDARVEGIQLFRHQSEGKAEPVTRRAVRLDTDGAGTAGQKAMILKDKCVLAQHMEGEGGR